MATTLIVERIDIFEGPSLNGLIHALRHSIARTGSRDQNPARFDRVRFYGRAGDEAQIRELNEVLQQSQLAARLVGIRYFGQNPDNASPDEVEIRIEWGRNTYEGIYDTYTRKGSLSVVE